MLPTIRHRSKGREVAAAKLLTGYIQLTAKLAHPDVWLEAHDTYDANFVSYVITWQKNRQLDADGVIGPRTLRAIAREAPTVSTATKSTGSFALAVQLLLNSSLTADAVFGTRTKKAVAAYQSAVGLDPDGICGEKTWRGLITGEVDAPKKGKAKKQKPAKAEKAPKEKKAKKAKKQKAATAAPSPAPADAPQDEDLFSDID